jgi:glycine cleavage system protein P-like pyridoxal-binding family
MSDHVDDPREQRLKKADLDRKTDALLQIAAIAGRVAAGKDHERPTRQELETLDGLYAAVGAAEDKGKLIKSVLI